jgi:hypothetical protein
VLRNILNKSRFRINILYLFYRYYTKRKARSGASTSRNRAFKSKVLIPNAKNSIQISDSITKHSNLRSSSIRPSITKPSSTKPIITKTSITRPSSVKTSRVKTSSTRHSSKDLVVANGTINSLATSFFPTLNNQLVPKKVPYLHKSMQPSKRRKKKSLRIRKRIAAKFTISQRRLLNSYWFSLVNLKAIARFGARIDVIKTNVLIPHNGCKKKKLNVKGRRAVRV